MDSKIITPILQVLFFIASIFLFACSTGTDADICDINKGPCVKRIDNIDVVLDVQPKPLQAFRQTRFVVAINNVQLSSDELVLDLTMPGMFMGKNQIILKRIGEGSYEGTGIIPRCPSGRTLWQADVFIPQKGMVSFRFHVK